MIIELTERCYFMNVCCIPIHNNVAASDENLFDLISLYFNNPSVLLGY